MASAADQLPSAQTGETASQPVPWMEVGWFGLLLIIANYPIISHLVWQWANDEDVGHGFFVPLVAGYIAWQRRDQIMALDFRPNWWGAALMMWGVVQGYLGMLVAELFLQRTSVLISTVWASATDWRDAPDSSPRVPSSVAPLYDPDSGRSL